MTKDSVMRDIRRELEELHHQYPALKDEDLFVTWFLRAYITEDLDASANAMTNGPSDKGVDAVFIDHRARAAFVIQAKYRHSQQPKNEGRSDVIGFAQIAHILASREDGDFKALIENADPTVVAKLTDTRKLLLQHGYRLWLYYVTLGRCGASLKKETENVVRSAPGTCRFEMLDLPRIAIVMRDYLDGVAPPIPTLDLVMEKGHGISVNGILQRYDALSKIESWVFSMRGDAIADLYEIGGRRLFARNIRGFLGESTDVNQSMESTLTKAPGRFFYYNNGITILCDDAERVGGKGRDILRVSNPQIINGQQTTRTLAHKRTQATKASVIVRVIQVPRGETDAEDEFDALVSQIVEGTNWQNHIQSSDLVSNDRLQIELHRDLRKRGYLYLRKRESKSEARGSIASKHFILSKMEVLTSDLEVPLSKAVDKAFDAALNYWRRNRGKRPTQIDVSTFFRNKRGRHKEFNSFWRGKNNSSRNGFEKAWKKVAADLSTS